MASYCGFTTTYGVMRFCSWAFSSGHSWWATWFALSIFLSLAFVLLVSPCKHARLIFLGPGFNPVMLSSFLYIIFFIYLPVQVSAASTHINIFSGLLNDCASHMIGSLMNVDHIPCVCMFYWHGLLSVCPLTASHHPTHKCCFIPVV